MTLHKIKMLTKPFWVPIITVIYVLLASNPDPIVLSALFFGYIGDLLLMRSRKRWFIAGAFSFLIGHMFYVAVFIISSGGLGIFTVHPQLCTLFTLPYIAYLVFLKKFLGKNVSSIYLAAAIYISVLMIMSYSALLRIWNVSFPDFLLTFSGSILFIISDTLIVIRNFKRKFKGIGTIIVITYIAAQLLIIAGLV